MTTYRATRNEPRVGVGNWTGDFYRGHLYEGVEPDGYDENGRPTYPRGPDKVPEYIGIYLASHGVLVDARISEEPADTPTPPSAQPPVRVIPIAEMEDING
jgi:hypothetical protein